MNPSVSPAPSGNLAIVYQEVITSIVRLRTGRQAVADPAFFRNQFREALKVAHEEARNRGYSDEANRDARFATVAFLDESILNLRSAVFADWARKPLQEELFGIHVAGEIFFKNLERLLGQVDSQPLGDVLEVYLLCLALGFAGRYSVSTGGELRNIRKHLLDRLHRIRGTNQELAPAWRPEKPATPEPTGDPWVKRLVVVCAACVVLTLVLYGVYWASLSSGVSEIRSSRAVAAGGNQ